VLGAPVSHFPAGLLSSARVAPPRFSWLGAYQRGSYGDCRSVRVRIRLDLRYPFTMLNPNRRFRSDGSG
jgi:hypothetical protein